MAKPGFLEPFPSTVVTELKNELHKLVMAILDEDDYSLEFIDEALDILKAFNQLKLSNSFDSLNSKVIPDEFKCPLSGDLMADPIVLSSGQTYDRVSIQKQQNDGLSEALIIPNSLVREIILQWCKKRGIELPNPAAHLDENVEIDENRGLNSLIEKLSSSSLSDQIEAAQQLRLLTKTNPKFRVTLGESDGSITNLALPLVESRVDPHPDLQENLIAVILNISIPLENKEKLAAHPLVLPVLTDALKCGNMQTRSNAAAALFTLSAIDSNKLLIGNSGAFKPLINLVKEENQLAAKDAAAAIYSLCIAPENRAIAVREGAVSVMFRKIVDGILVDELATIIAMLCNYPQAVVEMVELNGVSHLLRLSRQESSGQNKENFVVILYAICLNDRGKLNQIREEEDASRTLMKLARYGTSRAKRKAEGILQWLEKAAFLAHTS